MIDFTVSDISAICNGKLIGSNSTTKVHHIIIDSRYIPITSHTLFVALKGHRHNGHHFINELYLQGIKIFIIEEEQEEYYSDACYILVENTVTALQQIACKHRTKHTYTTIGITGSYGKSIVKEWLFDLLNNNFSIVRSPKSYNSQIGVPLSVLQMGSMHNLAIFEAGISKPNEMDKLEKIIQPTIGIFTNIGKAHQENFCSLEQKILEKLKLFKNTDYIIFPSIYTDIYTKIKEIYPSKKVLTWGYTPDDVLQLVDKHKDTNHTYLTIKYQELTFNISTQITEDVLIENLLTCLLTALHLGINIEKLISQLNYIKPIEMRLEITDGINRCTLINDYYNSDLTSISVALKILQQQNKKPKKIIILSDIPHTGFSPEFIYSTVGQWINEIKPDLFVGIGNEIRLYNKYFPDNSKYFDSTEYFIKQINNIPLNDTTILLKGARKFTFELIRNQLQQLSHETTLTIDLNALLHNFQTYKALLPSNTQLIAMVKAFSYGSGLLEIAKLLQNHNASYLAVAFTDEGIELRKHGIHLPIMVMSPEHHTFESIIEHHLEPVIYNFKSLHLYTEAVKKSGFNQLPFHLKLDTGMHRLGFTETEFAELIYQLKDNQWIFPKTVFSHLAAADDTKEDEFTLKQIELFNNMVKILQKEVNHEIKTHVQNSAGIERFQHFSFDFARIGIGLYGISRTPALKEKLLPVLKFKTVITQIKKVKKGETIGYNRKGIIQQDGKIAVLPIGYADGLNRKLSNGAYSVKIRGQYAPTIGTICMDMCMVDISHIDASEGDEVIIFDSIEDVERMAKVLNTIPYEIFTSISQRVKRIYYHD